jgi:ribose-phosphate pyrophosphokinase
MPVVFNLSDHDAFAGILLQKGIKGEFEIRRFPDGESYVRILSQVKGEIIYIVCNLYRPDDKIIPLYFLTEILKENGAQSIRIISPYLPYLRHDIQFKEGEAVTALHFAKLLSTFASGMITFDPHLHRIRSLNDIYKVPVTVLSSAKPVAEWILSNVTKPYLIGPDVESEQWVSSVAALCKASYLILEKDRKGDDKVEVKIPELTTGGDETVIILDDIISTGESMLQVILHLQNAGVKKIVCIGIHALFAGNAYEKLLSSGAVIVTCNTVRHPSNAIFLEGLLNEVDLM